MPNFVTNAGEEVYVAPSRPVFRRGKRLDEPTVRRVRDILISMLHNLGMSSEDIGKLNQSGVTSRQVRNRINHEAPIGVRDALEKIAMEIIASARNKVAAMPQPVRRPKKTKNSVSSGQLMLSFDDEEEFDERLVSA